MRDSNSSILNGRPPRSTVPRQNASLLTLRSAANHCDESHWSDIHSLVRVAIRLQRPFPSLQPASTARRKVPRMPVTSAPAGRIMQLKSFQGPH
jgi:hypothetical protein